jgi:hypothetical protein
MLLSIYTPTHNPIHILHCYNSLLNQRDSIPWEWIIIPNGDTFTSFPSELLTDKRIKIYPASHEITGIGALKSYACERCAGDVFIELDHDDQLPDNTFGEIAKVFELEPEGFYYSDFINLRQDGTCETYGAKYGWEHYKHKINNKEYTVCSSFEPSARALCHIYFAPNHIRAWSKSAYLKSGGYDNTLKVGDDHDLLCRTYLAGCPFVLIKKPLYIYRRWRENSFLTYNKEIQDQQQANCDKYLHALMIEESNRRGLAIIDIGRKEFCMTEHNSIEVLNPYTNALDLQCLSDKYEENSVGVIRAFDVLQRIAPKKLVSAMNCFYRLLAPGSWLSTATPSICDKDGKTGKGAFQDPSHQSYWSENNFDYYTTKRLANLLPSYYGRFQSVRCEIDYPTDYHKQMAIPYIHCDLSALKAQRQPGECLI